jgi:hypothetical protein
MFLVFSICVLSAVHIYLAMFRSPLLRSINFHRSVVSHCYRERIFRPTFVHSFGHILLTGCSIDLILFLLHSYLQGDHSYAIGWCVHHLIAGFWL